MADVIPIFDGHNDVLLRLYRRSDDPVTAFLAGDGSGQLDLPRASAGGFAGGMFACFVPSLRDHPDQVMPPAPDLAAAQQATSGMFAIARELEAQAPDRVQICGNVDDIAGCIKRQVMAIVLHLEGAEAIDPALETLESYYRAGLRSLGPVWSRANAFGTGVPFRYPASPDIGPGLTEAGKELVRGCNRLGILVDLSHLNAAGVRDVAALSDAPLVATHSCAHALCPSARNLTDDQLMMIRESKGVVGLNFSVTDLGLEGQRTPDVPIETMARHLSYLIEHLGSDGVALGSDFDGAVIPVAIKDASGLLRLVDGLKRYGFDDVTIRKITSDNWLSVLRRTWKN